MTTVNLIADDLIVTRFENGDVMLDSCIVGSVPALLQGVKSFSHHDLVRECVSACHGGGLYLEFGVASGGTMVVLRRAIDANEIIYGFDSFKGLPEAWNGNPVGAFSVDSRVDLPNVILVEGMFADTLPDFTKQHRGPISFVHIDCDIYSATSTVLTELKHQIVVGTTILFDEYFGYDGWQDHEHKAFSEFIASTGHGFEYIGRDNRYRLGIKIIS